MRKTISILLLAGGVWAGAVSAEDLLPGPVLFQLKETEHLLDKADRELRKAPKSEEKRLEALQAAKADVAGARAKMEEMEKRHAGEFSPFHPDVVEIRQRFYEVETKILERSVPPAPAAAAAAAPVPTVSAPSPALPVGGTDYWRSRLRPFVLLPTHPDFDPAFYLEPHATADSLQMKQRLDVYSRAASTLTEYRQSQYGTVSPVELQRYALDIETALRRFGVSCLQHADQELADVDGDIQRLEQFVRVQEEHLSLQQPIEFLDRDELRQLDARIARAARLVRGDDFCLLDLRQRFADLQRHDARLRLAGAADTRMKPDVYTGADAIALRQAAARSIQLRQPSLRVLRVALTSPAWREETVVEWGDYNRQKLKQGVIRSLSAQVAARQGEDIRLFTVDLRQVRLPSGRWGPLDGRILFVDPMLEKNLP